MCGTWSHGSIINSVVGVGGCECAIKHAIHLMANEYAMHLGWCFCAPLPVFVWGPIVFEHPPRHPYKTGTNCGTN